ncbi:hypothetical protein [Pseudactinotalea sp. Z1748]|uniref:hypothetical protein n=1 Tax=Pseudactinotalea sp. Z1748 TaxID=3413027 RepID=UPI003C7B86E1
MSGRWTAQRDDPVPDDVARLLATVPDWFGQPEANAEYVEAARSKETWTVRDRCDVVIGVTLVDRHFAHVAEIHFTVSTARCTACCAATAGKC